MKRLYFQLCCTWYRWRLAGWLSWRDASSLDDPYFEPTSSWRSIPDDARDAVLEDMTYWD